MPNIRIMNINPDNFEECFRRKQQGLKGPKYQMPTLFAGDICIIRRTKAGSQSSEFGPKAIWFLEKLDDIIEVSDQDIDYWNPNDVWWNEEGAATINHLNKYCPSSTPTP